MSLLKRLRQRAPIRPVGAEAYALLNDDEIAITAQLLEWVLRCAYPDEDIRRVVEKKLEGRSFENVRELNGVLGELAQKGSILGGQMQMRFRDATNAYLERVHKNENAYAWDRAHERVGGFWPNPTDARNKRSIYEELPYARHHKFIDKTTPISSAGSCFAVEIAHQLQSDGYNYVITERNRLGGTAVGPDAPADSSAAWGIIFNTPSFRQLVERSFGVRDLPKIMWSGTPRPGGPEVFMDPFREHVEFLEPGDYLEEYERHNRAARAALETAKVFIITLGLNEVWYFRMDGSVFSRSPWRIAPSFVDHKVLTVQENVDELTRMLKVFRQFNSDIKVIVSLSPIPLHATFLRDKAHIVEANTHSKAVLRVAAQQFVDENEGVYYFPSYELITAGIADPWTEDQRHVKRSSVARVMSMFKEMFVLDQQETAER